MRLSICIPTHNRGATLRPLLASIARQTGHGMTIEVVISDNASEDDTVEVVQDFIRSGMAIRYDRSAANLGFDRNMLRVVALASGEYCWLFGSDDIFEQGAFARLEEVLGGYPSVTGISVGAKAYSKDLSRTVASNDRISADFLVPTVFTGQTAIVKGAGPWGLGFISSIIVRRQAWADAVAASPVELFLNGYVHIYVLVRALDNGSVWVCVPDPLVGNRSGNDQAGSIVDEFKRTRLDIVGFDEAFAGALGRRHPAYHDAMSKVGTFYIRSHFLHAKARGASSRYWRRALPMAAARFGRYPAFWVKTMPIALTPRPLAMLLKRVRDMLRGPPPIA